MPMREYTEQTWQEEMDFDQANPAPAFWTGNGYFAFGGRIPCPNCATVGFYSPRFEPRPDENHKYRVCKFCGFAQELTGYAFKTSGEKPYRWVMVQCADCNPRGLFGVYDWKVPWDTSAKTCGNCKKDMSEVKWPSDDPEHPFHKWKTQVAELLAKN